MRFITSFSAAVCVAGGFAIVLVAFVIAAANLLSLPPLLVWGSIAVIGVATLWLFLWVFSRSWHVERGLAAGEEIDDPKLSILENWRD
jgi:hypothetical protein